MGIAPAHPLIDHILKAQLSIPAHIHAHGNQDVNNAGVLTDRPLANSAHPRVNQHLSKGRLCRRRFFLLPRLTHGTNKVRWMVVGDVLQRICNTLNNIFLFNYRHRCSFP